MHDDEGRVRRRGADAIAMTTAMMTVTMIITVTINRRRDDCPVDYCNGNTIYRTIDIRLYVRSFDSLIIIKNKNWIFILLLLFFYLIIEISYDNLWLKLVITFIENVVNAFCVI